MDKKPRVRDFPSIEITLKAYNTKAEPGETGLVTFKAFCTDVEDKDGNTIGVIGGGLGALVVSISGKDGEYYMIPHDDIWYAIQEAREANG